MISSRICNNINLNQTYNLNNSNSKEKVSRNNKTYNKSKLDSCKLNRNDKIIINPFIMQNNPKSKKFILTKKLIESNKNKKIPYRY